MHNSELYGDCINYSKEYTNGLYTASLQALLKDPRVNSVVWPMVNNIFVWKRWDGEVRVQLATCFIVAEFQRGNCQGEFFPRLNQLVH